LCRREEGVSLPAKYNSSAAPPANYSSALVQVGIRSRMCKRKRSFPSFFCYCILFVLLLQLVGGLCNATRWWFVPGRERFSPAAGDIGLFYYTPSK
jgi:hypothetical protein